MKMKKNCIILLLVAAMLALAACGGVPAGEPAQIQPAEGEIQPAEGEIQPTEGETAVEDGQNPVMNFVGDYVCDRAEILVEAQGSNGAKFTVTWGGSYDSVAQWTMSGEFDPETLSVYYNDCVKTILTYAADGSVAQEEQVYENGHGVVYFSADEFSLTWTDDIENMAEGMVFRGDVFAEPQEESSFADALGTGDAAYYTGVTAMDKLAVEQFAFMVRDLYLSEDWAGMVDYLRLPVNVNGVSFDSADDFLAYMQDKTVDAGDYSEMALEDCHDMFFNGQGICMGAGEVWLLDPNYMTDAEPVLQILSLSGIVEK